MMKLNKPLNINVFQAIGTASATLWARKTNPDATDGSNNNNDRTRWRDPNQQQQNKPFGSRHLGAMPTTRTATAMGASPSRSTTTRTRSRKSGRDAPTTGHQQEQGPSGCTPGNNNKPPGEGMPGMPSWLDYCFEYEAVAARNVNKDNNMLA
ncbi:hypothetical protein ACJ7V3_17660 [Halomonas elongata]|uniref:hypothetical protein n=1 Tax=Halomonas elongata TaxID=2746 RepID=UPI0038D47F30